MVCDESEKVCQSAQYFVLKGVMPSSSKNTTKLVQKKMLKYLKMCILNIIIQRNIHGNIIIHSCMFFKFQLAGASGVLS